MLVRLVQERSSAAIEHADASLPARHAGLPAKQVQKMTRAGQRTRMKVSGRPGGPGPVWPGLLPTTGTACSPSQQCQQLG